MKYRKSGGLLTALLAVLRTVLFGALLAVAKAFGGHPKIPDPVKRNEITQVQKKR